MHSTQHHTKCKTGSEARHCPVLTHSHCLPILPAASNHACAASNKSKRSKRYFIIMRMYARHKGAASASNAALRVCPSRHLSSKRITPAVPAAGLPGYAHYAACHAVRAARAMLLRHYRLLMRRAAYAIIRNINNNFNNNSWNKLLLDKWNNYYK